jgi:hypothetical protein
MAFMKTEREIEARLQEEEEQEKERERRLMGEESDDSEREERQVEKQTDSKHPAEKGECKILHYFAIASWMCRWFVRIGVMLCAHIEQHFEFWLIQRLMFVQHWSME